MINSNLKEKKFKSKKLYICDVRISTKSIGLVRTYTQERQYVICQCVFFDQFKNVLTGQIYKSNPVKCGESFVLKFKQFSNEFIKANPTMTETEIKELLNELNHKIIHSV